MSEKGPANAFLLTLVAPGLGHRQAGAKQRGALVGALAFAIVGLAVVCTVLPPLNPPILILLAVSVLAVPLFVLAAAIDAARQARRIGGGDSAAGRLSRGKTIAGALIWFSLLAVLALFLIWLPRMGSFVAVDDVMAPTVMDGERTVTWRDYYRSHLPVRGDVSVVLIPGSDKPHLMRIIGLPGDSLISILGVLSVNGQPIGRERIGDFAWRDAAGTHRNAMRWRETLPGGGDYEILLSTEGMLGGTLFGGSLRIPDGTYFVIGDNRDKSRSSWDFGFLPGEVLSDRPTVILNSPDRGRIGRSIQP